MMETDDETTLVLRAALEEAWRGGYQQAVDTLIDMIDDVTDNEKLAEFVRTLADALQGLKP